MTQASFRIALASIAGISLVCAHATGQEWPRFRGPNGAGIAEKAKPPIEFGPKKNLKFKVDVPEGASSPVIAGERLFLTAIDDGKLISLAYSTVTGKELWRAEAPAKKLEPYHKTEGSPAASSIATDGKIVVAYFGSCGLFAYKVDGEFLWKYDLPTAATAADFGTGVSPVLAGGKVILVRDELKEPKIIALDSANGSMAWEKKRQSPTSYCTPVVWEHDGKAEIVSAGYGRMVAYDPKDGAEAWSVMGMPSACCASPFVTDGTLYFAGWSPGDSEDKEFKMPSFEDLLKGDENKDGKMSKEEAEKGFLGGFFDNNDTNKDGFITKEEWDAIIKFMSNAKNSAFAVKPGGKGDVTKTHLLWQSKKGLPYVPSGIVLDGQMFLVKDGGLVTVYDAKTGKELASERTVAQGRYYASPVAANGLIYTTCLDDGTITVIKPAKAAPEVVTKNPKLGERAFATPAIAHDTLYVRTQKHLWAFAEAK